MAVMPELFEIEEPEQVQASHLLRVTCARCGRHRAALAAPGQERKAACAGCWGSSPGAGLRAAPHVEVAHTPVARMERPPLAVPAPHPAPERSSRDAEPEGMEYPKPVLNVAQRAAQCGFRVHRQSARGHGVHGATGRPLAVKDSFAVRVALPDGSRRAVAVYAGTSWDKAYVWGAGMAPFLVGVTDLLHWLDAAGDVPAEWYQCIRERRAGQALAARKVKCPQECTEQKHHEHRADGTLRYPKLKRKADAGA